MVQPVMIYDAFSEDYDHFVNWQSRLAVEMPFLESQLRKTGVHRVLDAACGTGMHAIALAKLGFEVAGADVSQGMVEHARSNAQESGVKIQFETAGFEELNRTFGSQTFEAIICLGNSLPHVLAPQALSASLKNFADCLKPGGLVLIQSRNFDAVMSTRERWMEPQSAKEGQTEWLFLRFYDFDPDGLLTFHVVILRREGENAWSQADMATRLRPILHDQMKSALHETGFEEIVCFGDMNGTPFNAKTSGNLVVTARLPVKK